jgi:very-short-patch-repair endonuclease
VNAATTDIRLAIELDDRTHQRPDRRDRDTFVDRALATAGVPILRVPAAARYDPAALKGDVHAALRRAAGA